MTPATPEPWSSTAATVVPTQASTGASTTLPGTTGAHKGRYTKHSIDIRGLSSTLLVGEGGSVESGSLTLGHNSGLTLFSKFSKHWEPDNIAQLKVLGKMLSFTVDLSRVGCACNLAFYLISAPGLDWNGKPDPGTDRGGQPPYYCDANMVGGQWCPEIDIMEANNHAFQATPHKCDPPANGHYSSCDRGGCEQNTRDRLGSYGPGKRYTIDTTRPFEVKTEFLESAGSLTGMRTALSQDDRQVVLDHAGCDSEYLKSLSDAVAAGMSLRITYWGDSSETMAWMDSPPCGRQSCGSTAGNAVISNISIGALPSSALTEWPTQAATSAPTEAPTPSPMPAAWPAWGEPSQLESQPQEVSAQSSSPSTTSMPKKEVLHKHAFTMAGVSPAILAGSGGTVSGGNLTLRHNSGYTLFSEFADSWEPSNIAQLKVLGKLLRFTVDLSDVGCACNLALYLISSPALDWNGMPSPGTDRGGQPPYYCDANEVGGQWCPEIDIMEANNHAFQATPHKCDEPANGHYTSCDRAGCEQSTRELKGAYGPGKEYTIDTRQPFEVQTEFLEAAGVFSGMKTSLRQDGRQVVLDHSSCKADYLASLSDALAAGMSLRITYWGDTAETMAG